MEEDAGECGRHPRKARQCERDHRGVFPLHYPPYSAGNQGGWFLAGQPGRDRCAGLEGSAGRGASSCDRPLESEDTDRCIILRKQEGTPLLAFEGADWVKLRYLYLGAE